MNTNGNPSGTAAPAAPAAQDPAPKAAEGTSGTPAPAAAATPPAADPAKAQGGTGEPAKVDPPKETPKEPARVVPEKYELKIPEGSLLKPEYLEKKAAYAKEHGLTQEEAQAALEGDHRVVTEFMGEQTNVIKTRNDVTWVKELMADPDIGGVNFVESGRLAQEAAEGWFGKSFAQKVKDMHMNHEPEFFRGLVKLGRAMANDKAVFTEHRNPQVAKRTEDLLWPDEQK